MPTVARLKDGDMKITGNIVETDIPSAMKLKSDGNFYIKELIERPLFPSDAYYFPLGFNGKDSTGVISPVYDTNTVYSVNGVWVGSATTNLYTTAGNPAPITMNGGLVYDVSETPNEYGATLRGAKTWKLVKTGTGNQYHGWESAYGGIWTGLAGDCFSVSGKYKCVNSAGITALTPLSFSKSDWSGSVGVPISSNNLLIADSTWRSFTNIGKFDIAYTGAIAVDSPGWTYSTQAGLMYIDGLMWEKKPFPSPFVDGTRGACVLTYNFNRDLGLNWSTDWSIVYWKKPVGTSNDLMTGYSIESLGNSPNSVGGGYRYWGKNTGSDTIGQGGNPTIPFSKYFNIWHMISLVKSGTTVTIKFHGIDGVVQSTTMSLSGIPSNYFVSQAGWDFQLGGWAGQGAVNSYYRDLVVAKRALTDTELSSLYNTQMRVYNGGRLNISGNLIETSTL